MGGRRVPAGAPETRTQMSSQLRAIVRRVAVPTAIVAATVLVCYGLVIALDLDTDAREGVTLPIGHSTHTLAKGSYGLWWQTAAHPDERPEFSDFRFRVSPAGPTTIQ